MSITSVQQTPWSYVLDRPTRVLMADDDPILCEFASVHLSSPTTSIETVRNGADALAALRTRPFDIALLDIQMPPPDGFSLLQTIRNDPALTHMPVIMLTGCEDIASIDRAFALGATSFVTKPVNWRLLSYQLRYVLRTSRQLRGGGDEEPACGQRAQALSATDAALLDALSSIAEQADTCRPDSAPTKSEAALARISAIAAAALHRWRDAHVCRHWTQQASTEGESEARRPARCA
ncbi:MAG: response regulator [Hyphomicrobiales bacterium]|nr:response regulator [Hyphomicrobiales bacterium]